MRAATSTLLSYPREYPAEAVPEFVDEIRGMSLEQLQELYTQTFDWSPETSLELGWHLYGENYERGEFLVKIRALLRRYGIAESEGLPDHVAHIIPLLEREPQLREYVLPAVKKIESALAGGQNPYRHLIRALREEVEHE